MKNSEFNDITKQFGIKRAEFHDIMKPFSMKRPKYDSATLA